VTFAGSRKESEERLRIAITEELSSALRSFLTDKDGLPYTLSSLKLVLITTGE